MMEQYLRIKQNHRDAIIFFRLGDFYEMFYEDAKLASSLLEITLTSRQKVPMCGIPFHAASSYLARLLRLGYKVAVCEQVEDPRAAKGVVRREVVKILTPGTAVEVDSEEAKENIYIAGLYFGDDGWGLALIDLSSGRMRATQGGPEDVKNLEDELFRLTPKEIVYPEDGETKLAGLFNKGRVQGFLRSPVEAWLFDFSHAENLLLGHFGVRSLAGFGLDGQARAVSAAGALLHYLKKIRKDSLRLVTDLSFFSASQFMILDATTVKNLELVRNLRDGRVKDSLLEVIDHTVTAGGGRLLRTWLLHPLRDAVQVGLRLDAVEEFVKRTIERHDLRESLKSIFDLERLTGKISLSVAHPRDLVALRKSLIPLPKISNLLVAFQAALVRDILGEWDNGEDVVGLIDRAILEEPAHLLTEGGIIKNGYDAELDGLREVSRSGKSFISRLEQKERERTGISSLKVRYNKVFGYYLEVTKANLHLVPSDFIRKQTLVGGERFLTPELKDYEEKVLTAEEKIAAIENRLFSEIREKIARETERLQRIAAKVASLDVLASLAEVAVRNNYSRPSVDADESIRIREGRHPMIERTSGEPFISNDADLDCEENQILIITGPNMGGKSTYLRQVALIVILAQMGSFVPAKEAAVGIVDRIFTRIGAMDFLNIGQSTFMVEMIEMANILRNATRRSLILLDEVGRGTSTFDGLSIAWAVAEYLHDREDLKAKTLFATHYHELTELALTMRRIKNHHVSVKEWKDEIIFLRKVVPGPSDQSYGIHVAKLAGIPREVISRAKEVLFNLEKQELDEEGLPRIAYRAPRKRDKAQLWLFQADRETELLREIREGITGCDLASLTPLQALNFLHELKEKLEPPKK